MNNHYLKTTHRLLLLSILLMTACSSKIQPIPSSKASLGYVTQVTQDLRSLPPPKEKIVLTIYKFKDQTGQYKENTGITYSTAVTQGATAMLIKALKEAGNGQWFTVLERESIGNLLNERKIIQQTRQQYSGDKPAPSLPPLLYSPLILEGGVISYQSNSLTGGFGAKYLGVGGDTEFQRDSVSIYLRTVSVQNGQILQSVDTTKTIFSIKVDLSVFKFVALKDLLEVETGFTSNEPAQLAVLEAIEKAVHTTIIDGVLQGLWQFKDPQQAEAIVANYKQEKSTDNVPYTPPVFDTEAHTVTQ
jgi:curli production assembly/transport component CsgG